MIKIRCNRLYKGGIDIRSHTIKKALENNEPVEVECVELGKSVVYSVKELQSPRYISKKEYKSKFGNEPYKLHSYQWKENE